MVPFGRQTSRKLFVSTLILALCPALAHAEDWPKYRHDLSNTGHSGEGGIASGNVSLLKEKWHFDTGGAISASPAIATVNGVSTVFIGNWSGAFYALNAVTGQEIWSYRIAPVGCAPDACRIGSSPAFANGVVYFGAADASLYALNAANGQLIWKATLASPPDGYEIWSSPAVDSNGTIYIGLASHDDGPCVVGHVMAIQASNGAIKWDFPTIDQATCPGPGACVGAAVWSSPAVDQAAGVVFVGTGNPGSTCGPPTSNAGKYPDSILALHTSNGTLCGYYQAISNDTFDLDFGASPVLYNASPSFACQSTMTLAAWIAEPSKNGKLYTLQRGGTSCLLALPLITQLDSLTIASPAVVTAVRPFPCIGIFPTLPTLFNASSGGKLSSVDSQDRSVAWQLAIGSQSYSAPAVIADLVFVGSSDAHLYGVSWSGGGLFNGGIVFSFATGGAIYSGPAISNSRIYFGSTDNNVYALSLNGN